MMSFIAMSWIPFKLKLMPDERRNRYKLAIVHKNVCVNESITWYWILYNLASDTYSLLTLTSTSAAIKGVNCVECKLLHCECRASKGVDYHCNVLVFSGFIGFQYPIGMILVSKEAQFRVDSNDSSPMCIACKTKKLFKFF